MITVGSTEWWRGWIVTRDRGRVVLGVRRTNRGLILRPYPRLQGLRVAFEWALLLLCLCIVARVFTLPRPLTLTVFAGWVLVRFAVTALLPSISRTIVLDDEHLRVEGPALTQRHLLMRMTDVRGFRAEHGRVLVLHRRGCQVPLPIGRQSEAAACAIVAELSLAE